MRVSILGRIAAGLTLVNSGSAIGSSPPAPPPTFSLALRNTTDLWGEASGGVRGGVVILNKLQASGTVQGDAFGLAGFSAHAQVFRTDGSSLSDRVGDIQTASNIEALPVTRLFEAWVDKRFGNDERSFSIRAGLMDLNSDFDSVQTSSLFINSSHGIGPDLSRSGRNGPSIFPVSAVGLRLSWLPSTRWTFRIAAFDGVPGDPARPRAFVAVRLARGDGALTIAQADYHLSDAAKIEVGAWRYSAATDPVSPNSRGARHDQGFYASIEGPIPATHGWSAWLRAGAANRDA
ncbi:MAG: carbohydrate porin, partial [Hyphomicrobiales bacterium]|nr:carbohydrate porin [Hyphomicrobiales bacterium]